MIKTHGVFESVLRPAHKMVLMLTNGPLSRVIQRALPLNASRRSALKQLCQPLVHHGRAQDLRWITLSVVSTVAKAPDEFADDGRVGMGRHDDGDEDKDFHAEAIWM